MVLTRKTRVYSNLSLKQSSKKLNNMLAEFIIIFILWHIRELNTNYCSYDKNKQTKKTLFQIDSMFNKVKNAHIQIHTYIHTYI